MMLANVTRRLLAEFKTEGCWEGHLSSSALATTVAVFALAQVNPQAHADAIRRGLQWLAKDQNPDGGWGDAPGSPSNLSTTLLCWSAWSLADAPLSCRRTIDQAEAYVVRNAGSLRPEAIAAAVIRFYGNDRTFSAPILTVCALAGRLGKGSLAWQTVPQLPFELSVLPHQVFKWLRLPVVSYAIPALIAIGLVRHQLGTARWSLGMELRNQITPRALKVLTGIQPESGGFLEATPLTSFVVMSLAASGQANHPVTVQGTQFLVASMREDGSWPIDTHLATWVTTLAVQALSLNVDSGLNIRDHDPLPPEPKGKIRQWLLAQQHRAEHRFTHAAPGGWAWTPRSGGVPDADDTAGVLLALRRLGTIDPQTRQAATAGITWLLDLQNADGGMPTFCRGWGKLPFDRSCPDITAHALRALAEWRLDVNGWLQGRVDSAVQHGVAYLRRTQRGDGSWCPLWFGNQHAPQHENLTYGTAQVVTGLRALADRGVGDLTPLIQTGGRWLLDTQHASGGWGGGGGTTPTIEETALALGALAGGTPASEAALQKAVTWLKETTQDGTVFPPSSIGLYFASLWYHEKLYPMIFMAAALRQLESNLGGGARDRI